MRHPSILRASLHLAFLLTVAGCGTEPTAPAPDLPIDLALPWTTAPPEDRGVDGAALERSADAGAAIPRLRNLLVVRDGQIVLNRYYGDASADEPTDVRSVTKSVVSLLTGIAIHRGDLSELDATLGELLPPQLAELTPEQRTITVRHLLTMSGGWTWDESTAAGYNDWVTSEDPLRYLLDRPQFSAPGTGFRYNSAAVHLLGVVLEQTTGRSLPDYAEEHLFGPLGIHDVRWEPLAGGVNGGSGLDLRPEDMARLGQLLLQGGRSGELQVVPEDYVAQAMASSVTLSYSYGGTTLGYGYLWWTDGVNRAALAWGYGGQFIYVAPERGLVVVATTRWWREHGVSAPADLPAQVLGLIVGEVVPAVPPR